MSRCFPFPPPGYEKKGRTDGVDLLIKDKHKEKKHKKEKRDKNKEGNDKDKERNKDKDREKKERKEKHKDKDKKKSKDKKKIEGQPECSNGGQHSENQKSEAIKDTKFAETCRKIAEEERGRRDQMVENLPANDPKKDDGVSRLVEKYFDNLVQEKETNMDKDGHDRKSDRQRVKDDGRSIANAMLPSFSGTEQRRVAGTVRPMDKGAERKMEGKEKNKGQEGNGKQEDNHKHRDGEKKSKEKQVAEKDKMKENVKHEYRKHDRKIEVAKDRINTLNIQPLQNPKENEKSGSTEENLRKRKDCETTEENLRKRKDCETNGFSHDNVLPNKLPRPTLSAHPLSANGRKSEQCQPASPFSVPLPRGANNLRFDNKVLKVNGLIQAQPTSISSTSPSIPPPPAQVRENGEASKKPPPHPDSKYLSQILTVPKMDDWSDFDDQEWLFSSDSLQVKKPQTVSSGIDGSPQVWDRAMQIDSADVCALPYVIPY